MTIRQLVKVVADSDKRLVTQKVRVAKGGARQADPQDQSLIVDGKMLVLGLFAEALNVDGRRMAQREAEYKRSQSLSQTLISALFCPCWCLSCFEYSII
mmetsp:Transcript_107322/g.169440  ORF Transcript_107322/g.169440 Transcript_107322/m.169440 type:complete len:99 (+) Transcript_107322:186-482(+)